MAYKKLKQSLHEKPEWLYRSVEDLLEEDFAVMRQVVVWRGSLSHAVAGWNIAASCSTTRTRSGLGGSFRGSLTIFELGIISRRERVLRSRWRRWISPASTLDPGCWRRRCYLNLRHRSAASNGTEQWTIQNKSPAGSLMIGSWKYFCGG